jgi:F0F1-type ATP synthase membrane subunit b/b'
MQCSKHKRPAQSELAKVQAEGRKRIEAARNSLAQEKTTLIAELVDSEIQIVDSIMNKLIGSSGGGLLDRASVQKAIEEAC